MNYWLQVIALECLMHFTYSITWQRDQEVRQSLWTRKEILFPMV